jgi:hypothetical protein
MVFSKQLLTHYCLTGYLFMLVTSQFADIRETLCTRLITSTDTTPPSVSVIKWLEICYSKKMPTIGVRHIFVNAAVNSSTRQQWWTILWMGLTGMGDRLTGTSESLLLCRDGKEGVVFCGIPDWVYEGERDGWTRKGIIVYQSFGPVVGIGPPPPQKSVSAPPPLGSGGEPHSLAG